MNPLRPLTTSETRSLLDRLQLRPNKALGQNFLIDANIVRKSIALADLQVDEPVIEIGPGLGTLSAAILASNCPLYAVERDQTLVEHLRVTYAHHPRFHLLHADACTAPLAGFQPQPGKSYAIVANLPYAISSPWLEAVLESAFLPRKMVLLVQKETALRLTAPAGSKNRSALGVFLEVAYQPQPGHPVSASCFFPKPKVDSILFPLQLRETPYAFHPTTRTLIRRLFSQRRKQIRALARQFLDQELANQWLSTIRSDSARPEAMSSFEWQQLDQLIRSIPEAPAFSQKI